MLKVQDDGILMDERVALVEDDGFKEVSIE